MTFDEIINQTFNNNVPPSNGINGQPYKIKAGDFQIAKEDLNNFQELFTKEPNKGVGNGEVSIYYLFNYHKSNIKTGSALTGSTKYRTQIAKENRGENDPDLIINGKPVEIKAYTSHSKFSLGRFQAKKEFREIISLLFSVDNIANEKSFTDVLNFSYKDIARSAENLCQLRYVLNQNKKLKSLPFLDKVNKKIEAFDKIAKSADRNLGESICYNPTIERPGGDTMALEISKYITLKMLEGKPGDKGFIMNLIPDGTKRKLDVKKGIKIIEIDFDKFEDDPKILGSESPQTFTFNGGAFSANFLKLFP